MISIGLTVHTEDKAVNMAADDITSVEEATIAMATIAVATVQWSQWHRLPWQWPQRRL
jgi:hypothetical protein